ncbi:DivIVA domain-containing protein [Micromonospora sp. DR5-3]|uniref:DivIVA domain-containing protein n=1 Tax=unclassified Micromonospora TaxID=2617518 RepID=UPI0011DA9684|nr:MULTISPECIES: DivIVA domain-containing protein [unclassified Micromonospora]MCW3816227.1 DivIVA domain-containing protein [Micromonospora sp. DR5-3]TYC23956.1 DivIVA domain-containing protein [Micromonospora sp. MP36]
MGEVLLLLVVALTVAAVVFGVTVLVSGRDPGLVPAEPDGRAVPLPGSRPLDESDVAEVRFDTALRGYRMAQVDQALRRAAYDIGYKSELIGVLEAEVAALRAGRTEEADALRRTREEAAGTNPADAPGDPGDESTGFSADAPAADTSAAEATDPPAAESAAPLTADAGLAAAPAAAAVEDEATLPSDTPTPAGPAAPVAAPADEAAADRAAAGRAAAEPTPAPADDSTGTGAPADDGERKRGAVVRSESA